MSQTRQSVDFYNNKWTIVDNLWHSSRGRCKTLNFRYQTTINYLAVRHLLHVLEGWQFTLFTTHTPLTSDLSWSSDMYFVRESRLLDWISQFALDTQQICVANNVVADTLSRTTSLNSFQGIEFLKLAQLQRGDTDFQHELSSTTVKLRTKQVGIGQEILLCRDHPIVPEYYRCNVFSTLHNVIISSRCLVNHRAHNRTLSLAWSA